ncbi:hypothetical protein BCM02_107255 [Paenibacillus methanolicus]|uniref:DUF6199 domain-containing protein n=1 Tax=Paenibacillus methanolicus TaxID=582686 RepID=A0A5S5C1G2_9BACL|nr:hypothetical protein BCM02_107255 [Paenibacillus methanolicus]
MGLGIAFLLLGVLFTFFPRVTHYISSFKLHISKEGFTARGDKIGTIQLILTRTIGIVFLLVSSLFLVYYFIEALS